MDLHGVMTTIAMADQSEPGLQGHATGTYRVGDVLAPLAPEPSLHPQPRAHARARGHGHAQVSIEPCLRLSVGYVPALLCSYAMLLCGTCRDLTPHPYPA